MSGPEMLSEGSDHPGDSLLLLLAALIMTHAESLRVGPSGPEIGYSIFSALYKYPE